MLINYQNAKYIKSVVNINQIPHEIKKEIIIIGKSNVGKSSFINTICYKKIAKVSSIPGKTKYLNYFLIDNKYYLIDTPGYGFVYKKNIIFNDIMNFILSSQQLKGIIFMLDSRRELSINDKVIYNFFIDHAIPFFIILSKSDKLNQSKKNNIINNIKKYFTIVKKDEIFFFNIKNRENIDKIKNNILLFLKKN